MLWNCQHILISCNLYVIFREMRVAFPHPHPLPHRPSFRKPLTILPYLVITFNFLILPYLCLSPYLLRLQTATAAPLWQLESGPLLTSKVDENLKLHKDDDHSGKCAPVWHDDMYDHRRRRLFALPHSILHWGRRRRCRHRGHVNVKIYERTTSKYMNKYETFPQSPIVVVVGGWMLDGWGEFYLILCRVWVVEFILICIIK